MPAQRCRPTRLPTLPLLRRALLALLLLALLLLVAPRPAAATPQGGSGLSPVALCRAAIAQAEREAGLPPGLLAAIGRVESGRRDPESGQAGPWPWTVNAEGRGSFYPDRAAALAAVRAAQAQGVRSIDVGCMQINLRHHPDAFASLEDAFEPLANARYAARFLAELQATRGDWLRSAAHYHSQTPEHAEAYRARVVAAWEEERGAPAAMGYAAALRAHGGFGGTGGGGAMLAMPPARGSVQPVAAAGGGGRGLDAYRARPIPVIGGMAGARPALVAALGAHAMVATARGAAPAMPAVAPGSVAGLPALAAPGVGLAAPMPGARARAGAGTEPIAPAPPSGAPAPPGARAARLSSPPAGAFGAGGLLGLSRPPGPFLALPPRRS